MKPSVKINKFIKGFEKLVLKAYMPTPHDVPTIGYGSTGKDVKLGMIWTEAKADDRFARDMAMRAAAVEHMLRGKPTTQMQFDALCSFAQNVGLDEDADNLAEGLGDSSLLRKHLAGDYEGARAEFAKWDKQRQNGKLVQLKGLTKRRAAEARIYGGDEGGYDVRP